MSSGGIRLVSLIPGCGYGDAATQYAAGLADLGLPVSWYPTRDNSAEILAKDTATKDLQADIRSCCESLWNTSQDCDTLLLSVPPWRWHRHWLNAMPGAAHYTQVAWEVERVPEEWVEVFKHYQRVFVPSTFNRDSFIKAGVCAPVDVVPHIARTPEAVEPLAISGVNGDDFVFYTVGAWTARKAIEDLVVAFLDSFGADEKVVLVIKTDAIDQMTRHSMDNTALQGPDGFRAMSWYTLSRIVARYRKPARIHLLGDSLRPAGIDALHTRGDCFISLTRSEGWGLGAFDALLHGNPVVITGWGGQLDYLGSDYPYLVDYTLRPTRESPPDGYYLRAQDVHWAHADTAHAGQLMRRICEQRDQAAGVARDLQNTLRERYSRARIATQLAALMERH